MLDVISGGRLVAGFPVGTPMDTNFCYGQIPALTRDKYREAHDMIMQAWAADEPFAFDGKYNQLRWVNCWPKPIQKPHPPIYIPGGGSIETWDFCLDHDYNYSYLSFFGYLRGKSLHGRLLGARRQARQGRLALPRRLRPDHLRGRHRRRGRGALRRALPLLLQPVPARLPALRRSAGLPHRRHHQVRRALAALARRRRSVLAEPHVEAARGRALRHRGQPGHACASSSRSASRGCASATSSACSTTATCRTGRRVTPPSSSPRRSCRSSATSGRNGSTTTAGGSTRWRTACARAPCPGSPLPDRMRIAAIEVSHWHSLYDSAYLRHLAAMPDVQLVGVQDPSAEVAAQRAAALGGPPVFTDYPQMLAETRPDFVVALGRHSAMADTAHYLLDAGLSVPHGKADGDQRRPGAPPRRQGRGQGRLRRGAARPALPAVHRARPAAPRRGAIRAAVPHLLPPEPADLRALYRVGLALDARSRRRGRRLPAQPGPARLRSLPVPDRRGRAGDRRAAQPRPRWGSAWRTMPRCSCARPRASSAPSRSAMDSRATAPTASGRSPAATPSSRCETTRSASSPGRARRPRPVRPRSRIALTALRDALDHWRRGEPPPISVADCARVGRPHRPGLRPGRRGRGLTSRQARHRRPATRRVTKRLNAAGCSERPRCRRPTAASQGVRSVR